MFKKNHGGTENTDLPSGRQGDSERFIYSFIMVFSRGATGSCTPTALIPTWLFDEGDGDFAGLFGVGVDDDDVFAEGIGGGVDEMVVAGFDDEFVGGITRS